MTATVGSEGPAFFAINVIFIRARTGWERRSVASGPNARSGIKVHWGLFCCPEYLISSISTKPSGAEDGSVFAGVSPLTRENCARRFSCPLGHVASRSAREVFMKQGGEQSLVSLVEAMAPGFTVTFQLIVIAEEEIAAAISKTPERAEALQGSFLCLQPSPLIRGVHENFTGLIVGNYWNGWLMERLWMSPPKRKCWPLYPERH